MNPEDIITTAIALVALVVVLGITTLPTAVQTAQGSTDTDHYNRDYGDGCNRVNVPGGIPSKFTTSTHIVVENCGVFMAPSPYSIV